MENLTKKIIIILEVGMIIVSIVIGFQIISTLNKKVEETKEILNAVDSFITAQDSFNQTQVNFNEKTVKYFLKEHQKPTYEYLCDVTVVIQGLASVYNEETNKMDEQKWMGTGVVVKIDDEYTYILTNNHVSPNEPNVNIYVENGSKYLLVKAEIIKNAIEKDIALIRVKGQLIGKKIINGIGNHPQVQDKVYLVGHHLGDRYTYGEGVVAGTFQYNDDLVVQLPTLFGDSGSGLFNQKGELVGLFHAVKAFQVFFFGVPDVSHGLCIPIADVKEFLKGEL